MMSLLCEIYIAFLEDMPGKKLPEIMLIYFLVVTIKNDRIIHKYFMISFDFIFKKEMKQEITKTSIREVVSNLLDCICLLFS